MGNSNSMSTPVDPIACTTPTAAGQLKTPPRRVSSRRSPHTSPLELRARAINLEQRLPWGSRHWQTKTKLGRARTARSIPCEAEPDLYSSSMRSDDDDDGTDNTRNEYTSDAPACLQESGTLQQFEVTCSACITSNCSTGVLKLSNESTVQELAQSIVNGELPKIEAAE